MPCGLQCPALICFRTHQALRSLKAKQRTEKRIEALHAKLDTVQGILDRIYASQTDQMVATPLRALWSQAPSLVAYCLNESWVLPGCGWVPFPIGKFSFSECKVNSLALGGQRKPEVSFGDGIWLSVFWQVLQR